MRRWVPLTILGLVLAAGAFAALSRGPITLAWDAVTLDENSNATTILYYNVRWGTSSGQENSGTQAATSACSGGACQMTVRGLDPAQLYWFVVTAINAQGESVVSNEVSGRPTIIIHR